MTENEPPPLCAFMWRQGVGGKRHLCNKLNYPSHTHSCCCGVLLSVEMAGHLRNLKGAGS